MIIIILLLQPLVSKSKNDYYQKVSLPLYNEYTIETIEDKGMIYKYYITEETNKFTLSTYCKAYPSYLKMDVQYQLRVSHQTESQFQLDFINGTYYGKTSLIKKGIATNYGIILLTTDKVLEFILHNATETDTLTQKFQVDFINSIDDSEIFYIEENNRLILLQEDNVFEYEIVTNEFFGFTISFIKKYWQHQIVISQIKQLKILGPYIFILTKSGNLNVYNSLFQQIIVLEQQIIFFDFSLDTKQPKLIYIDGNSIMKSQLIQIDEKLTLNLDKNFEGLERFPNASMFVEYTNGILIVREQDQGSIIIDYQLMNEEWTRIKIHYVQFKIRNIIIEQSYAILISENTQKVITAGINGRYLNKQNFRLKNIDQISGLQDILIYQQSVSQMNNKKHLYAYTRSKLLRLDLKIIKFIVNCTCQNETEALNSPFNVKFQYFSSVCEDCETVRQYTINFNYPIITQENIDRVLVGIVIGILIYLVIIGIILKKYLLYRKCIQNTKNGVIHFETIQSSPKDASISDNKIGIDSVVPEKAI